MEEDVDRRHGSYTPRDTVPLSAPGRVMEDTASEVEITGCDAKPVQSPAASTEREQTGKSATEQRNILQEAYEITGGDRQNDYGTPEENWGRISRIASAMCEMDLSPEVCTKVLIATKLARMITSPKKRDNYVDLAGYTHVLWEVMK